MSIVGRTGTTRVKWLAAGMLVLAPALVWTQNKNEKSAPPPKPAAAPKPAPPKPAAPAPHPATATAPRPGTTTTAKPNTTTTAGTGATTGVKPNTNTAVKPNTNTAIKPNTNTAVKPNTNTALKPGATTAGKPGVNPATRPVTTMATPGGGKVVTQANGSKVAFNAAGARTSVTTPRGAVANFNSRGQVTTIHSGAMTINRGAGGQRTVAAVHTDARGASYRVVNTGAHAGYVERNFVRNGQPFVRRTYVVNGQAYTRVYGGYYYHGIAYYHYYPGYYYAPGFYGWAYAPWAAPVVFGWGWGPWYPYYGYYFAPYPVYAAPYFWVTDYMIAANLQAAYAAQAAAAAQGQQEAPVAENNPAPVLTPEVKQAIADEVRAQIEAERAAAQQPPAPAVAPTAGAPGGAEQVPGALDPNFRTFIVANALSAQVPDGTECSLTAGDVLTRLDDSPDANLNVKVMVSSSQRSDCRSGTQLAVSVQDLQDMRNSFEQNVNEGMGKLAENQGKGQIPAGPAASPRANPDAQSAPDLTAVADLQKQEQEADQSEREVAQASGNGPAQ